MQALPILCLLGPTAVGKSQLAMDLCEALNAEIISVDSAMIYKGMDIGTAKPTLSERESVKHHLIDCRDPSERYNVADFCQDALACIEDIRARGKRPFLVGGTMMYFQAFWYGLSDLPARDESVRQELEATAAEYGWEEMHHRLEKVDPLSASRIKPTDPQRIQRALEVYVLTNKPLSEFQKRSEAHGQWPQCRSLAIVPNDRALLHERIKQRFMHMLEAGFVEEVQRLFAREDLHSNCPALRSVGYRQVWSFLENEYDYEEMKSRAIIATRQLAKRQLTWIRSWKSLSTMTDLDCSHDRVLEALLAWNQ